MKFRSSVKTETREPFRLWVGGSRTFTDRELLHRKLDALTRKIKRTILVVHGGAKGTDRMAGDWAWEHGWTQEVHHPDWAGLGKKAGMVRNKEMAKVSDAAVFFWDEESPGTQASVAMAKGKGIPVRVIPFAPIKVGRKKT